MMLSDEEYAILLLRPLDREPGAPSTVDVGRAVATGRRHRRRVVAGTAGAAAVTAVVVAGGVAVGVARAPSAVHPVVAGSRSPVSSPTADPVPDTCTLQQLPVPAGQPPKSVVTGGDPTGRYIIGRSYPGGASHPVLIWDNGQVHAVTMTGQDQSLTDINAAGVAVGVSVAGAADQPTAWVYQQGRLARLAGDATTANGINERGVIVGSVGGKPVFWSSAGSAPTMLAMPGAGWTGQVNAIDEDGTMVGEVHSGPSHGAIGYLWHPDGTGESLPVPVANGKPVDEFTARSIRNGWVVGWAALDVGPTRYIYAPRWSLRTGTVDVSAPSGLTAEAVNDRGWIAGSVGQRAVLTDGGAPVSLPDLGGTEPPVTNTAYTISDDGTTLAGQVESTDGNPVAVRWRCQ